MATLTQDSIVLPPKGMTTIKLLELELRNFQRSTTTIVFDGQDFLISGTNGAGKTTLANAWFWLWTNKDLEGKGAFDIKTLTSDGEALHNLEHSVKATLDVDGERREFQRVYQEQWQAQRGSKNQEKTLKGHVVSCYVDGVPKSETEFKQLVAEICQPELFRMLGDPAFFGKQLNWEVRRKELVKLAGDISIDDVVASEVDTLEDLPGYLDGKSPNDRQAIVEAELKRLKPEADEVQPRIDELMRQIDDTLAAVPVAELEKELTKAQEARVLALAGGEVAKLSIDIQMLRTQKQATVIDLTQGQGSGYTDQVAKCNAVHEKLVKVEQDLASLLSKRQACVDAIDQKTQELESLMAQDVEAQKLAFVEPEPGVCVGCGRPLPEDQVQAARDRALADFNDRKATLLQDLMDRGEVAVANKEKAEANLTKLQRQIVDANAIVEGLKSEHARSKVALSTLAQPRTSWDDHPDVVSIDKQIAELEQKLESVKASNQETEQHHAGVIAEIEGRLKAAREANAKVQASQKAADRIKELQESHKQLQVRIETNQRIIWLIDQYHRAKAKLLSDRINQFFSYCSVKLFEDQLNGGVREVCEVMVDGVPWGSANHGSRVNAGLEIINAFSQLYGVTTPIWLDNAESVATYLPTVGQQIRLVMDPSKPTLTW